MLKHRVIPTLLVENGMLVKGVGFDGWRRVGALMPAVKVFNRRDVDELIVLDITATREGRGPDLKTVRAVALECSVPLTVGGGVKDTSTVRELLRAGADKIALNSALFTHPTLLQEAARLFGSQCIVASIDVRSDASGKDLCSAEQGKRIHPIHPDVWAKELQSRGAGEILLTRVERDGTMTGYDIELIRRVSASVTVPLIASGGCGSHADMVAALHAGADAVAAGAMFQFTEQTPREAKRALAAAGFPVRSPLVQSGERS